MTFEAAPALFVIPGLVPGIQRSANSGASRWMDPGNKCRGDNLLVLPKVDD